VLNCTACKSLNWEVPLSVLLRTTVDVSLLLRFHWYQPVFYDVDDVSFPSSSHKAMGYFVGISTNMDHTMTFKVLTDDTHKVIVRSQVVRPADDPSRPNLHLTDLFNGERLSQVFVRSKFDSSNPENLAKINPVVTGEVVKQVNNLSMVPVNTAELVDTSELIGWTF
jgi:hypothetical protein